jgi:hypothetical protein
VLALLGETVGTQLPMLVKLVDDPLEDLPHALTLEELIVPSDATVDAYFAGAAALDLMPTPILGNGGVNMNLSNFCPMPLAWVPYFLDFKTPYAALTMGRLLVSTLATVAERNRVSPFLDWLRAACVHLSANIDPSQSKRRLVGRLNADTDNAIVATAVNAYLLEIAKMQIRRGTQFASSEIQGCWYDAFWECSFVSQSPNMFFSYILCPIHTL